MSSITADTFKTSFLPTWCPGCGDFGIWLSLKDALAKLGIGADDGLIVYGIGCHGNMYDWMKMYGFAGLHGRALPVAQGAKLANHKLPVIVVSGDGDCLGEGGNHFIHAAKRNPDICVMIHDNQVYGLTTGQASPTAKQGFKTKSTPEGVMDEPVNPLTLAITAGATFVARGFAGDPQGLTALMAAAIEHKGFAVLDILQPCVTFDKVHTYPWYRSRLYKLETEGYTADNKLKAMERAMEWEDKIPVGIFYKEEKQTSEDREPALAEKPLVELPLTIQNLDELVHEFV
ncbi:2-oxoacid ferredoxin oxidoreductase [Candidatus Gottesmanbacteria bacterium RIFCSPLOWO2_01_FULL_48_11]|uniref:2-oxoacid ferredoxin oxidoreductase, subunit beta n=3 Tax=Candidatus Gottesmaniibacteriota TaxID=1752720 RepID=A0A0G1XPA8_9BACT|nr:MAG: 2-oxoacid ferredoxin oxidoreductase, subunit beta [Candidatus Gottesmanbacteria bacterium GW2011_GWA2_47_9]KKU96150.1 MAG: 2-oxoacid ferredoxin oxidoreductase, subunit beta [Candidatus Gottesmanbacteria bacterium GW2011_GWA1_48_13]OGG27322.1 MAG: 2-oxoacid ferredoxin oxidoreductase [Candidatus Gottesmanbacteria bacterium RIFCSPLOWO2_01_FULL_48_11]